MTSTSRIAAFFTLVIPFILIIIIAIMGVQSIGTQITHGNLVEHQHGVIISKSNVGNNLTFEFKTDSGKMMNFACTQRCLTQLGHMQRHINEYAPTDVYYQQENNTFVAVDVD